MSGDGLGDELDLLAHVSRRGGVADFDQLHATALELLRHSGGFVLVAMRGASDYIVAVHAVPEDHDDGRKLLLATIDAGRRALADRNRRQKGNR